MKKLYLFVLIFILLNTFQMTFAQSTVKKTVVPVQEKSDNISEPKSASAEDWKQLASLSGDAYVQQFAAYLAAGAAASETQPYALAECLWYECFIKPALSQEEPAAEPRLALNYAVSDFITAVGSGAVTPHVQSDTVYAFFKWLTATYPLLAAGTAVPAMPVFDAAGAFSAPPDELRKVALYRSFAKLEKLKETVSLQSTDGDSETAVLPAETVTFIASDPALLYVLSKSESGSDIYRAFTKTELAVPDSDCRTLLDRCGKLGVTYGFTLNTVLPVYSAGIASLAQKDDFALCYIPERDAAMLCSDLAWIADALPFYMKRITALLHRPAVQEVN